MIERKYPLLLIQDGINKALQKTKEELRTVKEKNKTSNIPFVSTFNPNNTELFGIINQNKRIIEKSKVMITIITKNPLLKSKRQPHNLLRFLTKAKFENTFVENTVQKCRRLNCGL